MLCVGTELARTAETLSLIEQYDCLSGSIGLHPDEVVPEEPTWAQLVALANHPKVIAIGETGLDYYRPDNPTALLQQARFAAHIEAAKHCQKPLIIHTRAAKADTLALLKSERAQEVGGIIHCFTEDKETAFRALDLGFYISFSGIITFKNALDLQAVAQKVPLDRLLIETDSPYLAPVPYRGQINQPAYVRAVAECVAALRGVPFELIAEQTTQNFYTLFERKLKSGSV